ncbi:NAD+ diphosphatase [Streptosporangium becharense]|uniref:NAD(+) diphosphatase n=1 Tax=Streptosporangium becharense TaxID=1816182 RepID=A0A7W9MI47_9ACTN|nr:NAD(+) diphosphatase [Streptosporangium becharense]MBB2913556.1 NAD+ diphosphatase [Streptosporangium becharense]MBB5821246.1 NAD+ diphosphatase [Streptosporangium becharense]
MEITAQEGLLGPLLLARSAIDRSAALRSDAEWLERAWADGATRVVVVDGGQTLVRRSGGEARLVLLPTDEAPAGERYLLGVDAEGIAYFAVSASLEGVEHNGSFERIVAPLAPSLLREGETVTAGLRQVGSLLGDLDAGLLVYAVALEAWHSTHEFCPRCGSRTEVRSGGHVRVCPEDGSQHFPRVDPAVIMLVHDDRDRCLLARGPQWPEGRLSVLAGFVEPGESLEHAVAREVAEEVGVRVTDARYLGSQPWPFPRSLMLGFFARATSTDFVLDPEEISEARWFTRAELLAAMESGEVRLPPQVSIARRLIETWYGEPLTGDW